MSFLGPVFCGVILLLCSITAHPTEGQPDNQNADQSFPVSSNPVYATETRANLTDPTASPLNHTLSSSQTEPTNATAKSFPVNTTSSPSKSNSLLAQRRSCLMQRSSRRRPVHPDYPALTWVRFSQVLPRFAVRVSNDRENRSDYICAPLTGCYWASGYYTPEGGSYCYSPCHGREQKSSSFDLLVNEDNLVGLDWRANSDWSPPNAVRVWESNAVGRSQHGLGTVYQPFSQFYAPQTGKELVLLDGFEVLVITGKYTEHIFNVKYDFNRMVRHSEPTVNIGLTSVTNNNCVTVKKTVHLTESTERQSSWETSRSDLFGSATTASLSVKIPKLVKGSVGFEQTFTFERTFTNTEVKSITQTITHSLSVELDVPPNHTCLVSMVGRRYKATIPYTATLQRVYENGEVDQRKETGIYKGAQVGEINAIAERCQPLKDALPCINS